MSRPSFHPRRGRLLTGLIFLLGITAATQAQTSLTWSGLGTDSNWTDVGNWAIGGNPAGAYPNNGQPTPGNTYNATVNFGTQTLNANITIVNLTIGGGNIGGGSSLNVNGLLSWTGGGFGGSGTITLNGGGTLDTTGANLSLNQSLTNASGSTITVLGPNALLSGASAAWTNQSGSTFTFSSDASVSNSGGTGTFMNQANAIFQKTGGTGTSSVGWNFTNNGTVNATSGTLDFSGNSTQSGAVTVGTGATVQFTNGTGTSTHTWTGTAGSSGAGTVNIAGGTVLFNGTNNTLASLVSLTGGTIDGTGLLTISRALTWTNGTMGAVTSPGAGTTALSGGGTLDTTGANLLLNRSLTNISTVTIKGPNALISGANAAWTNQGGSTFTFASDANVSNSGGTGTFMNQANAIFQKTGGTSTSSVGWNFTNNGTVNATSGTLDFSGNSTQSGAVIVGTGATVQFTNGTGTSIHTWTGTAGSTGAGTVNVAGGTVLFNGTNNTLASLVSLTGGTIDGTGLLTISGALTWTNGTMGAVTSPGAGTTALSGGGTLDTTGANLLLNRSLTNISTVTIKGPNALISGANAAWTNQGGSTFTFASDANVSNSGGTGTFMNQANAIFQKTGGTSTSSVGWNFANNGTVNATSGTLDFSGNSTQSGAVTVGTGATVQFTNGTGTSIHTWTGTAGSTGAGTVNVAGGTVLFNGTNNTLASLVSLTGGTIDGTGLLTISGALTWTNGTMGAVTSPGAGITTLSGGGTLDTTGANLVLNRSLTNASTVTIKGPNLLLSDANAAWTNQGGATFTFSSDASVSNSGGTGTFMNQANAIFQKTGGTGTSTVGWNFTNNGTVAAQSGTLAFSSSANLTNYSAGTTTLTGGTWQVLAGATLDLGSRPITTVAAGTTVIVSGSGSAFADLENHVTANAGGLSILGGRAFTPGGTLVNTGILTVGQSAADGSKLTGSVNVSGGGSLRGTGTVTGTATISSGGAVSPGVAATVGTLAAGQWVFQTGGTDVLKYNPVTTTPVAGADNDTITSAAGQLNLSALSSSSPFTIDLLPEFAATPAGTPVTYTAGTFSSVVLPGGVTASNLTSLFTFTGSFSGTPTASLDATGDKLQFTFTPGALTPWTWSGTTSGSWSVGTNWSPTGPPPSNVATVLTFGATSNAAMTNDIAGTFTLNSMTFNSGSPAYTLAGNGLNFVSNGSGGALPTLVSNSSNSVTINVPLTLTNNLTVSGSGNVTLGGAIGGAGSLTMSGFGTLALGSANTYTGGTNVLNGTVQAPTDAALGTGNVTGGAGGTLSFTGSTATTKSFAMNGGTIAVASGQTVTFNGSQVSSATLDGGGTVATGAAGALFDNSTSTASVAIASNSAKDQFVHFTNSAALTFAGGLNPSISTAISNFNGFTNEGAGAITVGAGSAINAANFQSYGTLSLVPNTTSAPTVFTNTGTAAMGFNGGSQTFIGTPATADPTGQNIVDYLDLHGHNAIVADGLFVNNGGVFDTSMAGTATIVADYGSSVKGAGFYQNTVKTQNGGKFQTGNSPGSATFGNFVFGPGGVNNYIFAIDDATGTAGPSPNGSGIVSGWGLIKAVQVSLGSGTTSGNFTWAATPTNPLTVAIDTLVNPTTVGTDVAGPMADFDPNQAYSWTAAHWTGTYAGPTDVATLNADTSFDTSGIVNPIAGTFGWSLDPADQTLSLVYTPTAVPEPGTLALTGLVAVMGVYVRRRRAMQAA